MNAKKILIFGKNGQVASNLLRLFSENKNFEITAVSSAEVDFAKLENLNSFLKNLATKPDIIINCSAYTNVDKAEDERELCDIINHQAVAEIAQFCHKNHIILIHYSTDYVFNGYGKLPFEVNNTADLQPLNHYGRTKLLAERAIINSLCRYIIFRVSWIYDLDEKHKNFYNTIKRLAKEKEVLSIIDDQVGSPTRADFIAENTIKIIKDLAHNSEKYLSKIFHLNNGRFISWWDFAVEIVQELKNKNEKLAVKEIKKIKTADYKTNAIRPLNSRLKPSFISLAGFNVVKIFCDRFSKRTQRKIEKKLTKFANKYLKISKTHSKKLAQIEKEFPGVMLLPETVDHIIENKSSICRFGDGEFDIATFSSPNNNYQKSSEKLTARLNEVLRTKSTDKLLICIPPFQSTVLGRKWLRNLCYWRFFWLNKWDNLKEMLIYKKYGNSLVSRDEVFYHVALEKLKLIWKNRDVVFVVGKNGRFFLDPRLFDNITSQEYVYVQPRHAFEDYDNILQECLKFPKEKLFFIAAGPTATVLAFDLYSAGYQALDFGHLPNCYAEFLKEKPIPEATKIDSSI